MTENLWDHRKNLSFREAEGLKPLPSQLKPKELSRKMRVRLWEAFQNNIQESLSGIYLDPVLGSDWDNILYDHHIEVLERFSDDYENNWNIVRDRLRSIFEKGDYGDVLELVQFTLRHPKCPKNLFDRIARIFAETRAAYRLINNPPTIIPSPPPLKLKP